jgi:hypothetical protein
MAKTRQDRQAGVYMSNRRQGNKANHIEDWFIWRGAEDKRPRRIDCLFLSRSGS